MNDFQVFNDFRVGAWVDGVTMRFAATEEVVKKAVSKAIIPAIAAAAFIAASVLSVPSTVAAAPVITPNGSVVSSVLSVDAEVDRMAADLDKLLADLPLTTEASVDPSLLALARSGLASSASRPLKSVVAIAEAFFPDTY